MFVNTRDLVTITEANSRGVCRFVADAENGRPQVLLRNGRPAAAVVDIDSMDRLQRLEEMEDDLRLLSIVLVRAAADDGRRHDLDDVLTEFDIDPGSLDDD